MTEITNTDGQEKTTTIYINGTQKQVEKSRLSFDQIVALAFDTPPMGEKVQITIQYTRGQSDKPKGTLVEGQYVEIVEGMEFDVTPTNRS